VISRVGLFLGVLCYLIWGFFPLYFHSLKNVSSGEILAHRILWSVFFLILYLGVAGNLRKLLETLKSRKTVLKLALSSFLVSSNWLVFILAVNTERTVDASLGYFINPILIVALGVVFLKEKLNQAQILSLLFAMSGLLYQIFSSGTFSWISLYLPLSFGFYGLLRKKMKIDSVIGLTVETLILAPVAMGYLLHLQSRQALVFAESGGMDRIIIAAAGLLTTVPLLLFAEGSRRLPFSWMGFLQYITPSLHFAIGVLVFHEPFGRDRLVSFSLVWLGLLILILGQVLLSYRNRPKNPPIVV
jgi:chloramphenicol-sensitive protein RarD